MQVWPVIIVITAGLTLWGWRHNAWQIPAIALCGYIAMRFVVTYSAAGFVEVAGCTSWLLFASLMVYKGGGVPGFFYALSALTYPALLVFGFRLDYMGLSPIIAEIFAALALLSIGGGIYGMANFSVDNHRFLAWVQSNSMGVALRQKNHIENVRKDAALKRGNCCE